MRTDPGYYVEKIEKHKKNIKNIDDFLIYKENSGIKIAIKEHNSFDLCINQLKELMTMPKLEIKDSLKISIPTEKNKQLDKERMLELILEKKNMNEFTDKQFSFHYDVGSMNAETSCVLQLVDDNCQKKLRQKNILNPSFRYVGITAERINFQKKYVVYITFSS